MKNFYLSFIVLTCFFSCDSGKKYQGTWTYAFDGTDIEFRKPDYPVRVIIQNDSIKFKNWNFEYDHSFPLKMRKGKFLFGNWEIKSKTTNDTLIIGSRDHFVRDENDSIYDLWDVNPITKISLPKCPSNYFNDHISVDLRNPNYYILFGRTYEENEFKLQLNDKHSEISDLMHFIHTERASMREELIPFSDAVLFIDHSSPLKYVEDIFYNLRAVHQLKVSFVNDIQLKYEDSIGLYYNYELLRKRLPYKYENDNYYKNSTSEKPLPPPPLYPLPNFPMFDDMNMDSKLLLLKKDTIQFNNKPIKSSELKKLVKPWIENNQVIFSLYDLESTYGSFLEMNAIINQAYEELRNNSSKTKFNRSFDELTRDEMYEVKTEVSMHHAWSYSIPHYNHIVEKEGSFYGLKAESVN